jgi:oligopeptide transport system substrate-binding protein
MPKIPVGVLLMAGMAGLGGCSGAEDPDTLVINNSTEPQTLDPGLEKGQPEYRITIALFEGLTVYDPKDLSVRPGVAESWEVSADGTVYTFHLRDAKWSNGDPLGARDFEWSWKRVIDPGALVSEYAYQIYSYLKNAKAYYEGASADLALKEWDHLAPEKRPERAAELAEQVQARHIAPLDRALKAEKDPKVVEALRKAREAAGSRANVALDQVGVRAKDDRTLEVTLETPTPYFLDLAAFFTYFPVPRKSVELYGKDWTRPGNLVGNGPYRLVSWRVKEDILVERNPFYWDAPNVLEQRIRFLPIENASTGFNLYEKGKIHWITDPPREYIDELVKRPDYHTGPFLTTYFYAFNVKRGVLGDKRIRRALALAIDKEKIVKYVTRAGEMVADSLVPQGLAGYLPATMPRHDPEEARKLLSQAGYPGGKGFPRMGILYNTQEGHKKIATSIQEMWRQTLGIETELSNVEWKAFLDMQHRLEFDVTRRAWIADYNDPNTFIDMFVTNGGQNDTGFSNAEYDRLVREAGHERDPVRRMKMLHEAEAILMDELPIVPIYFYVTKNLWKPSVTGVYENVRDTHPLNRVRLSRQAP